MVYLAKRAAAFGSFFLGAAAGTKALFAAVETASVGNENWAGASASVRPTGVGAGALAAGDLGAHGHEGSAGNGRSALGGELDKQVWVRCKILLRRIAKSHQFKGAR